MIKINRQDINIFQKGADRMDKVAIPVGLSEFERIREEGYYYIDKSGLIADLLKPRTADITLITRPRRFGKTLGMSMLASFFDIRKDTCALFEGLEITKDTDLCSAWLNRYPVFFMSFKDVEGLNFEDALALLKFTIAWFCDEHSYLLKSEKVTSDQKVIFERLKKRTASLDEIKNSFRVIMKMMQNYYDKPVILLLDEYDVPVAKASSNGYYREMLDVIRGIMSTALKDNPSLKFAVITGCLKIAKESIFTGTNNFVSDTIKGSRLNEYFGFTQKEVDKLLKDAGMSDKAEAVKKWYDGYHFGKFDIYCPWDVMNYVRDLQYDPDAAPASYWKNTSGNEIIRTFIDHAGNSISLKLETLMAGGYIIETIDEDLTYDYLHSSEENLWSILYLTGYLTRARDEQLAEKVPQGAVALRIPNAEIRDIFETTVKKWFSDSARKYDRKQLFDAVWNGDEERLTREMTKLLRRTISYHDYREDFYHAFLAGIFAGAGYMVKSNQEHGEGRSDVIVYDAANSRAVVFEAKYSRDSSQLETDCEKAIRQIRDKMYAEELEDDFDEVLCYGIAFYKKRCIVKRK